jgi:hypothetical protein
VRRRSLIVLFAFVLGVAACGDDAGRDMSPTAVSRLDAAVREVRVAIEADDVAAATAQLTSLRTTVVELTGTGAITPDRALAINNAITQLEAQLAATMATTTTAG